MLNKTRALFSQLSVTGFKSIRDKLELELRPLTILAGVNSSGKSSAMQPLLLLKQTLEASYDPGPLLISGPNVIFSSANEMLWWTAGRKRSNQFIVGLESQDEKPVSVKIEFRRAEEQRLQPFKIVSCMWKENNGVWYTLKPDMTSDEIQRLLSDPSIVTSESSLELLKRMFEDLRKFKFPAPTVVRNRSFLGLGLAQGTEKIPVPGPWSSFEDKIRNVVHVPGLRGNPSRAYRVAPIGDKFPGLFHEYLASIITGWQEADQEKLSRIGNDLYELGLTWKVTTRKLHDTQAEIRVGRLPTGKRGGAQDLVSIADVGFGVSQVLPVVVALAAAMPGQMVYLEQPEIHLHPRAKAALARLLNRAVQRGVQVVVETHSEMLLVGIQRLVAAGELEPGIVKLHWFNRDKVGATYVTSADLDENGAFGDWPVDFSEVSMQVMDDYLDTVTAKYTGEPL